VLAVRFVLPAAIVTVGILLAALGRDDAVVGAGVALVGVGMLVALLNVLMRLGIESGADRDREEEARRYFDRHGRWPSGR
jgi:hypothetical protein